MPPCIFIEANPVHWMCINAMIYFLPFFPSVFILMGHYCDWSNELNVVWHIVLIAPPSSKYKKTLKYIAVALTVIRVCLTVPVKI